MGSGGGGSMNWDGSSQISKSVKGSGRWGKKSSREEKGVWGERSVGMEKKRVMVVVDQSGKAKEAMMWALTHVANKGDFLTLLHVLPPHNPHRDGDSDLHNLAWSLGAQCKSCKPEVEVEVLVVEGPKLQTVLSQVRKLETSVLVLSQCKPSLFCWYTTFAPQLQQQIFSLQTKSPFRAKSSSNYFFYCQLEQTKNNIIFHHCKSDYLGGRY
ncbi:uncharacterized protein LOC121977122 isoform X1 [Zingiber officinale]|uniref:uncharacterized protein LOC121977122 isoform X1 n=1 Tax=Zingiber officinale TaxID=94328 RepID=UPI001C4D0528|nr:uncharacterized protein LOC121977122 isoform X1 [Zingiber officinale]